MSEREMRRTEIMVKVRHYTAFMERAVVRLDYLDLDRRDVPLKAVEAEKAGLQAGIGQAIKRVRAGLDQLEETLRG